MHYVFLLHGMGSSESGWTEKPKSIIEAHYDSGKYAFLRSFPASKHFELVEITYNDIFDRYLDEARKQAENLGDWDKLAKHKDPDILGFLGEVVTLAKSPRDKEKFLVTHIADVLLYMATNLGELVRNRIAEAIGQKLLKEKYNSANDSWSVLGHSLGTRVATELLQIGFSGSPSLASFGKAKFLMMVANTSKLLEDLSPFNAGDVYRNLVYPSNGSMGVCKHYINVTHRLDPIAFIHEFSPGANWGNAKVFADKLYHPIKLDAADITSKEIHSLEHYLEHPLVHSTLFRFLIPGSGRLGPTKVELETSMKAYQQKTLAAQITDTWRESLQALKSLNVEKLKDIRVAWEKYAQLLS